MHGRVFEWLPEQERKRWICGHMECLLRHLETASQIHVAAAGLENPKLPNALLFPSSPIQLSDAQAVLGRQSSLVARSNGLGLLVEIECEEHPVSLQAMPFFWR
jgi:hypothetical protein